MTLREWLRRFHTRPQMIVAIFLFGVWIIFAVRSYMAIETKHITYVKQTADLLSVAFHQNNRIIAESLLETLISQGGASSAEVCRNGKQEIGANQNLKSCYDKAGFLENIVEQQIAGSGTQILRARFSILNSFSSIFSGLGLSLIFVFSGFYFIQATKDKIKKDIFDPLLNNLLGSEPLEIKELTDLRNRIIQAQELEAQKAVTLAIQENNQQVAHDIRSPIASISVLLKMMQVPDSNLKTALDKAVSRANSVANFLLKSEKKDENQNDYLIFDAAKIVKDIALEKRPLFLNGSIDVEAPSSMFIDSSLASESLARILSNVVDNAMLACDKNKRIKIMLSKKHNFVEIMIRDSGQGISPAVLNRIGEKGFSQRPDGVQSGTGRGVYSAKKTLEEVGGRFLLTSDLGFGTTVSIQIPIKFFENIKYLDLVFIDDEELHRTTWSFWAETENKTIKTFSSVTEFLSQADSFPKDVKIFLDSDLGDGTKGQDYGAAIKELGFKSVYLTTGYTHIKPINAPDFDGIIGKDPQETKKILSGQDLKFKSNIAELK